MEPIKKLVLDYSKWRAGGDLNGPNKVGEGLTSLLNDEGYMCCLGQWICQLGAPPEMLKGYGEPNGLRVVYPPFSIAAHYETEEYTWSTENSNLSINCMRINDDAHTTPEEKIALLTEELKKEGIELEVINLPEHGAN